MALKINVLGPFEVKDHRGELPVGPKKAKALLAYLAIQGERPISRGQLADLLWPTEAPEQSRHSLRNCLSGIRRALGEGAAAHFRADHTACRLQDVEVDLALCSAAARSGERSAMLAATELYRGELLADFFIRSEPFEEWLTGERERALNLICEILERLCEKQSIGGDHLEAIGSARRLVALDRLSEAGHRALMRAYARAGRRAEALRHYRRCGEILKRELGVMPDAETDALAKSIARSNGPPPAAQVARGYVAGEGRAFMMSERIDRDGAEAGQWVPPWLASR
jgi:DNA-binding SARP family transcriptional activator